MLGVDNKEKLVGKFERAEANQSMVHFYQVQSYLHVFLLGKKWQKKMNTQLYTNIIKYKEFSDYLILLKFLQVMYM